VLPSCLSLGMSVLLHLHDDDNECRSGPGYRRRNDRDCSAILRSRAHQRRDRRLSRRTIGQHIVASALFPNAHRRGRIRKSNAFHLRVTRRRYAELQYRNSEQCTPTRGLPGEVLAATVVFEVYIPISVPLGTTIKNTVAVGEDGHDSDLSNNSASLARTVVQ